MLFLQTVIKTFADLVEIYTKGGAGYGANIGLSKAKKSSANDFLFKLRELQKADTRYSLAQGVSFGSSISSSSEKISNEIIFNCLLLTMNKEVANIESEQQKFDPSAGKGEYFSLLKIFEEVLPKALGYSFFSGLSVVEGIELDNDPRVIACKGLIDYLIAVDIDTVVDSNCNTLSGFKQKYGVGTGILNRKERTNNLVDVATEVVSKINKSHDDSLKSDLGCYVKIHDAVNAALMETTAIEKSYYIANDSRLTTSLRNTKEKIESLDKYKRERGEFKKRVEREKCSAVQDALAIKEKCLSAEEVSKGKPNVTFTPQFNFQPEITSSDVAATTFLASSESTTERNKSSMKRACKS